MARDTKKMVNILFSRAIGQSHINHYGLKL